MRLRRPRAEGDAAHGLRRRPHYDKLSRVAAIAHDEDEAPSREDKTYGETIFNRTPVPLPKLFRRGKPRR